MDREKPNWQEKYRSKQAQKGFVRYELQVPTEAKERFEELVSEVAEEYVEPYDKRQRLAKARAQVFEELTPTPSDV